MSHQDSSFYHPHDNDKQQHYHSESSSFQHLHRLQNQESNTMKTMTNTTVAQKATKDSFLKRILIVDDDPDITLALKTVLEDNGYEVNSFNDPTDAVSNFKQPGMYDLLIIDLVMPNMDGFEFYEKIREIDNRVKACFITAYNVYYQSLREIYPDFEVDCFMKKPIENEDLLRKVINSTT
jgi:two-component system, OmpR family, response regulator ChvI